MSAQQPQSLRKHRQTLVPPQDNNYNNNHGGREPQSKKDYGQLTVPGQGELPSVTQRDKEKVGNLVKRRFSSRPQVEDIYASAANDEIPSLPSNAADLISEAQQYQPQQQSTQQYPQPQQQKKYPKGDAYPPSSNKTQVYPSSGSASVSTEGVDQYYQSSGRRPSGESKSSRGLFDKNAFLNKDFDAQSYIADQLGSATDVEISKFSDKLESLQTKLAADKKDAMYSNYKTFLAVGNEISTMGNELDQLRKLLNDLHTATTAMKEDADQSLEAKGVGSNNGGSSNGSLLEPPPSPGGPKRSNSANRNSMMMLENMWAQELASLFRHVEGAQKYLPAIPGRHIIKESGGWYQLNAATWKPLQPVHIFLLNDHLLIATKKRNRHGDNLSVQPSRKLVADQCWPLQDIKLYDLDKQNGGGDGNGTTICVRAGSNNSFVYRTEKADTNSGGGGSGKKNSPLLLEFHKAKEELRKNSNSRSNTEHHLRHQDSMNYYASQTPSLKGNRNLLDNFTTARKSHHSREPSLDITGRTRSLREIDELMNDLDVKIAYRQFPEAVEIIEKNMSSIQNVPTPKITTNSSSSTSTAATTASSAETLAAMTTTAAVSAAVAASTSDELASQVLKMKLEQRVEQLIDVLLRELSQDYQSREEVQQLVKLLIILKAGDKAKHTLLESRRNLIRRRIKEVEFQGDIVGYISQVAIIHFRMIRSTIEIFAASYKDSPNTSSSLVEWAKNEIDSYILLFARQLFSVDPASDTYKECAEITRNESEQLKDVGLDLSFMLSVIYDASSSDSNPTVA